MEILADERAQSMTYIMAAGTLILFAGMYAVFQRPARDLLDAASNNCVTEQCEQGHAYVAEMWTWLPLTVAVLVVLLIIASSIYKSRGGL